MVRLIYNDGVEFNSTEGQRTAKSQAENIEMLSFFDVCLNWLALTNTEVYRGMKLDLTKGTKNVTGPVKSTN